MSLLVGNIRELYGFSFKKRLFFYDSSLKLYIKMYIYFFTFFLHKTLKENNIFNMWQKA